MHTGPELFKYTASGSPECLPCLLWKTTCLGESGQAGDAICPWGHSSVSRSVLGSRFGGNDLSTFQGCSKLANKKESVKCVTGSK